MGPEKRLLKQSSKAFQKNFTVMCASDIESISEAGWNKLVSERQNRVDVKGLTLLIQQMDSLRIPLRAKKTVRAVEIYLRNGKENAAKNLLERVSNEPDRLRGLSAVVRFHSVRNEPTKALQYIQNESSASFMKKESLTSLISCLIRNDRAADALVYCNMLISQYSDRLGEQDLGLVIRTCQYSQADPSNYVEEMLLGKNKIILSDESLKENQYDGLMSLLLYHRRTDVLQKLDSHGLARIPSQQHVNIWKALLKKKLDRKDVGSAVVAIQMMKELDIVLQPVDVCQDALLNSISNRLHNSSAEDIEYLSRYLINTTGFRSDDLLARTVFSFCKQNNFKAAHCMFNKIENPEKRIFSTLVHTLVRAKEYSSAKELLDKMIEKYGYIDRQDLGSMSVACRHLKISPSSYVSYLFSMHTVESDEIFLLMMACIECGAFEDALFYLELMNALGIAPNERFYTPLIKAASIAQNMSLVQELYTACKERQVLSIHIIGCAITASKHSNNRKLMKEVMEDAASYEVELDKQAYNDALWYCVRNKDEAEGRRLFNRMLESPDVIPDETTLNALICALPNDTYNLLELFATKYDIWPNLQIYTSMITTNALNSASLDSSARIVEMMRRDNITLDTAVYHALWLVATRNENTDAQKGLLFLKVLIDDQIKPSEECFSNIFDLIIHARGPDECFQLLHLLKSSGLSLTREPFEALVKVLVRESQFFLALDVLYEMQCDGHDVSNESVYDIVYRCSSKKEVEKACDILRCMGLRSIDTRVIDYLDKLLNQYGSSAQIIKFLQSMKSTT